MKVSTILIITAVAASIIALTAFNLMQKSFYQLGEWRNRFYGMEYIPLKNITDVELADAEKMQVTIEQGNKEGLYIREQAKEHLTWSKDGNKLKFEVSKKAKSGAPFRNDDFVIVLRRIDHLKTSPYVPLTFQAEYSSAEITLHGFKQNYLELDLGKMGAVNLQKMDLDSLNATIGNAEGKASLKIQEDSKVRKAVFTIPGESGLELNNPDITKATYNVSEKASVKLNGNALKILK